MSIAITEDHRVLADSVADFLARNQVRAAARSLLAAPDEALPGFWPDLARLGLLGLHLGEEYGGSGFGLAETLGGGAQPGRTPTPRPHIPTGGASAVLAAAGPAELRQRLLPGLADGSLVGAFGLGGTVSRSSSGPSGDTGPGGDTGAGGGTRNSGSTASGKAGVVLSGHLADVLLVPCGDDVLVIETAAGGVRAQVPANLDQSRRAAKVTLDGAPATVLAGGRGLLHDVARTVLAAEAAGIAAEGTQRASEYAKVRIQFGRPIATFQAVKHHCANMLVAAELATCAAWDAGRAAAAGGDQLSFTAAVAAVLAIPAAVGNAQLNIQVHGGTGFTWEHDAHLFLRRAAAVAALVDTEQAAVQITSLMGAGVRRAAAIDLPPEAAAVRAAIRPDVERLRALDGDARKQALIETGYMLPHWPAPWGRDASPLEQLVIEQELGEAGIRRPGYGITGWVILTLIQHASEEQVRRWVRPALDREVIWCQLFSEPEAGSDAAGIRTRAVRAEGGWGVNGQKAWTSGAHVAGFGLATVRT